MEVGPTSAALMTTYKEISCFCLGQEIRRIGTKSIEGGSFEGGSGKDEGGIRGTRSYRYSRVTAPNHTLAYLFSDSEKADQQDLLEHKSDKGMRFRKGGQPACNIISYT